MELGDGYITCKENITFLARRTPLTFHRAHRHSLLLHRVSTVRSAIELKAVFDQIQAAERDGNLSPEEKRKLEEQAAEKGLQALFKVSRTPLPLQPLSHTPQGAKLEIESVLRETCDKVLEDPSITPAKANLRAVALQILGEAYVSVRKVDEERREESEYVRIDTKGSARPTPQDRR